MPANNEITTWRRIRARRIATRGGRILSHPGTTRTVVETFEPPASMVISFEPAEEKIASSRRSVPRTKRISSDGFSPGTFCTNPEYTAGDEKSLRTLPAESFATTLMETFTPERMSCGVLISNLTGREGWAESDESNNPLPMARATIVRNEIS